MKLDFGSLWNWGAGGSDAPEQQDDHPRTPSESHKRKGGLLDRFRGGRDDGDRRREHRRPASGAVVALWAADGDAVRTRGELVDAGETGAGLGALIRKQPQVDQPAWLLTADGQALGAIVRHAQPTEDGLYRVGAHLDLEILESHGWGGVKLRWIDEEQRMRVAPASLRNASEGLVEASCVESLPVGALAFVSGHETGCLSIVRSCEAYGERCLLKLETVTDTIDRREPRAA